MSPLKVRHDHKAESDLLDFLALNCTEYALQSYSNILLGLTLILYTLAMTLSTSYPRWLGWLAAGSGVVWIIHGVMVPYVGLFNSIPRLVAIVLLAGWAFIIAALMWRNSSQGLQQLPLTSLEIINYLLSYWTGAKLG